jgi:prepilin-type N-terminal cleavage/methylation domain-containing protein
MQRGPMKSKLINNLKNHIGAKGFTLIELAVVMIVIGLLIASFSPLLSLQIKQKKIDDTRAAINSITANIEAYRNINGHYPCPASFNNVRGDVNFGHEGVCSDTASVAVGNCGPSGDKDLGYCIKQGLGTVVPDPANPSATITIKPRVRIGAVPFRELNMPDETAMLDGYDSLITYAVTEPLAVSATFNPSEGGITILDDKGASAISPDNSAHFIVISHGPDRAGARFFGGQKMPCAGTAIETDNCSDGADAVFRMAEQSDSQTDSKYDDTISYSLESDAPLWETSSLNDANIHHKTAGGVGIAVDPISMAANEKAEIKNIIRARGDLMSEELCDKSGCFASSLIAADEANAVLKCPPEKPYMVGIQDKKPVCENSIIVKCPTDTFPLGIRSDGTFDCGVPEEPPPPPPLCPAQIVKLCDGTQTLPESENGKKIPLSAGTSYKAVYTCKKGKWSKPKTSGACTCDPTETHDSPGDCKEGFSGTITTTQTKQCPSGTWGPGVVTKNTCVCNDITVPRPLTCKQAGYPAKYTGGVTQEHTHLCNTPEGSWSDWVTVSDTCACKPAIDEDDWDCDGGLVGNIHVTRSFTCPDAKWSDWTETSNTCKCQPHTEDNTLSCEEAGYPSDYIGEVEQSRSFKCPDAKWSSWEKTVDTCAPAPTASCFWKTNGSPSQSNSPYATGAPAGGICPCGTANQACSKATSGGKFNNYASCSCR